MRHHKHRVRLELDDERAGDADPLSPESEMVQSLAAKSDERQLKALILAVEYGAQLREYQVLFVFFGCHRSFALVADLVHFCWICML